MRQNCIRMCLVFVACLGGVAGGCGQVQAEETDAPAVAGDAAESGAEEAREQRRGIRRFGDIVSEDNGDTLSLDLPVPAEGESADQPSEPLPVVSLPDPALDARLQRLLRARRDSDDPAAADAALNVLLGEVEGEARTAIDVGEVERAEQLLAVVDTLDGTRPRLAGLKRAATRHQEVETLLSHAEAALAEGRVSAPDGDNALEYYERALQIDPENRAAQEGLEEANRHLCFTGASHRIRPCD